EIVLAEKSEKGAKDKNTDDTKSISAPSTRRYEFPPLTLLLENKTKGDQVDSGALRNRAAKLEETLRNFNVGAKVLQVTQGPTVTRYEIQPEVGVKVNSITRLADDIALNLEAKSIRIEAPIPGKAAVGIEVENERVNLVTIREMIGSKEFKGAKSKIAFAIGKDLSGMPIVADLKEMPHLLIAGSTGSGKSVCINSILTSLLYRAKPDEVKLVLIDPKVVELGSYNGIPHLLIPVVTDPSKAAAALNWAVSEMTDRYKRFAEVSVRDLEHYNEKMKSEGLLEKLLPQIVIIIDELADLMMAAPNQVEESICRLAQMARAAGMHLIVATQRPSVDIITGVIKANIPSRIAFAVSSQFDSRTILDMSGAEKLVGKGDMLFSPLSLNTPIRLQGSFITDGEVAKVIEFVKAQGNNPDYQEHILESIEKNGDKETSDDHDELLEDAIETVIRAGQASVSMLQRRFRIGYNRAARMIDMMEARHIIGPADGSRPRQVLWTEVDLYAMKGLSLEEDTED
ncbi:MAG: DNA translocase FtsK, partial [Dehalobacter sp. 4CP]|nr:DNA translocase FtsK [Dehalobacter sp. 4CP]